MIAIVCIKQVPETPNQVEWDPDTQNLNIDQSTKVLNPYDQFAVEEAIKMREQDGGKVVVLALGPERTKEAMRECLPPYRHQHLAGNEKALRGGFGSVEAGAAPAWTAEGAA